MEKMAPAYDDDDGDETSSYSNASSGDWNFIQFD